MKKGRYWIPALVWMGAIFVFSTDLFAAPTTHSIFEAVLRFLFPWMTENWVEKIHFGARKAAHITAYAFLSWFYLMGLLGTYKPGRCSTSTSAVHSILLCVLYATLDEWHQSFSKVRTGSVLDVAWDGAGAISSQLAVWIKRRFAPSQPDG